MYQRAFALVLLGLCGAVSPLAAQSNLIPQLSSRPGAAYTLYLNFGGFSYNGSWGGSNTPGVTTPYSSDNNFSTFSASDITNMQTIWSRVAEKYSPFNINVTTIDPAVAAGQAANDAQRQAYYDVTPRLMHTVVGGNGSWLGGGGGISYLGVAQSSLPNTGYHTNFVFSNNFTNGNPGWERPVSDAIAHENGHALGLQHQSLWSGTTLLNEYDPGNSQRAPIMGTPYNATRGLWRVGTSSLGSTNIQNDAAVIQSNSGIQTTSPTGYVDSGIGHTLATATPLPLSGNTIDFTAAKGIITPLSSSNPTPLSSTNYTADFFTFTVATGQTATLNVTLRSGRSTLTPGTADPGATLDATLRLLDSLGNPITIANSSTFAEVINATNLAPGTYFLEITSAGADTAYFDMGSYFLTGTFTPVPEPVAIVGVGALALGMVWRRRRSRQEPATTAA
jgi:hypothetical protein